MSSTIVPPPSPSSRPATSFLWFTSPLKTFKHIIWKYHKWKIIGTIVIIILVVLIIVFIYTAPVSHMTYHYMTCHMTCIAFCRLVEHYPELDNRPDPALKVE